MRSRPSYQVTRRRELTHSEETLLRGESSLGLVTFFAIRFFVLLFVWPFVLIFACLLKDLFSVTNVWTFSITVGLFLMLFGCQLYWHVRRKLFASKLAQMDIQSNVVEEMEVSEAEFLCLRGKNSDAYAINVGQEKILILQGDWLSDFQARRFLDALDAISERDGETLKEIAERISFPTRNFKLKRMPNSGIAINLEPNGSSVENVRVKELDISNLGFFDVEIFNGFLSKIESVIEREARFRAKVIKKMAW